MLYDYIQLTASVSEPENLINDDDSVLATGFPSTQNDLPSKFECLDGQVGLVMNDNRVFAEVIELVMTVMLFLE
jgi:hypothetical protein